MSGILAENKVKGDMCGRYYVDPEMTEQLEQVVGRIDDGIRNHRIAIPVRGFYEWNRLKEKSTFTRADTPVMYLAGICDHFAEEGQLEQWFDDGEMEEILRQTPTLLSRSAEYEQQRLF